MKEGNAKQERKGNAKQERKEDNLRESFPGLRSRTAVEALMLESRKDTSIVTETKKKGGDKCR